MSEDHKPNRADERKRIEEAGGVVVWAGTWRVGGVLAGECLPRCQNPEPGLRCAPRALPVPARTSPVALFLERTEEKLPQWKRKHYFSLSRNHGKCLSRSDVDECGI